MEINKYKEWCPVMEIRFDGENCPYHKGQKCVDIKADECIKALTERKTISIDIERVDLEDIVNMLKEYNNTQPIPFASVQGQINRLETILRENK